MSPSSSRAPPTSVATTASPGGHCLGDRVAGALTVTRVDVEVGHPQVRAGVLHHPGEDRGRPRARRRSPRAAHVVDPRRRPRSCTRVARLSERLPPARGVPSPCAARPGRRPRRRRQRQVARAAGARSSASGSDDVADDDALRRRRSGAKAASRLGHDLGVGDDHASSAACEFARARRGPGVLTCSSGDRRGVHAMTRAGPGVDRPARKRSARRHARGPSARRRTDLGAAPFAAADRCAPRRGHPPLRRTRPRPSTVVARGSPFAPSEPSSRKVSTCTPCSSRPASSRRACVSVPP